MQFLTHNFSNIIKGKCPSCKASSIYSSFLRVKASCANCNLALSNYDKGDGPIFFVISILLVLAVGFSLVLEEVFAISFFINILLTLIFSIIFIVTFMPFLKTLFIWQQYYNRIDQG